MARVWLHDDEMNDLKAADIVCQKLSFPPSSSVSHKKNEKLLAIALLATGVLC